MKIVIELEALNQLISVGEGPLMLFMYLCSRSISRGECFPAYDTIELDTGMNRHKISSSIKILKALGFLEVTHRFGSSTIYKPIRYAISSANSALMDDASNVNSALMDDASSANSALMDTQATESLASSAIVTLKQEIKDLSIEEESESYGGESEGGKSKKKPPPATSPRIPKRIYPDNPKEALENPVLARFRKVTGRIPGQKQYALVIDTLDLLIDRWGADLESELSKYWFSWSNRIGKNGAEYRKDNLTWLLEWAVNEDIPPYNGAGNGAQTEPKGFKALKGYLKGNYDTHDEKT